MRDERGKLTRWTMYLMTFDFEVERVLGRDNELPDALSRFPGNEEFRVDQGICDIMDPPRHHYDEDDVVVAPVDARTLRDKVLQAQHKGRAKNAAPQDINSSNARGPCTTRRRTSHHCNLGNTSAWT